MFSLKIVDTDAFLDMPQSSRLLYYDLSMRADDDGFVSNPKKIMRMTGSGDDDIKVLVSKKFIIPFDSGICVIKHWKIHNYIQKDRYSVTTYLEEKKQLKLKENGSYTKCVQNVSKLDTQVRLGKDRLGKVIPPQSVGEINPLIELFENVNPSFKVLFKRTTQRDAIQRLLKEHGEKKVRDLIVFLPRNNAKKFAPTITTPIQLENRLGEMKAFWEKEKGQKKEILI